MRITTALAALFTFAFAVATAGCAVDANEDEGSEDVAASEDEVTTKAALVGGWRRTTTEQDGTHLQFRQDGTLGILLMTGPNGAAHVFTGSYKISGGTLQIVASGTLRGQDMNGKWSFDVNTSKRTLTLARNGQAIYVFKRV